jgi:hypothetical protein
MAIQVGLKRGFPRGRPEEKVRTGAFALKGGCSGVHKPVADQIKSWFGAAAVSVMARVKVDAVLAAAGHRRLSG